MRCGTLTATAGLLLLVGIGYSIIKTDDLYLSHAAVTDDTISDLLERRNFNLPLENADLSFTTTASAAVPNAKVVEWQMTDARAVNSRPPASSLFDDDPTYRLTATLHVTHENGHESVILWESWRYGVVVGPLIISMGDGPPGFISVVE